MFITQKALSRRTLLRGMGATLALPLLDAMVPSLTLTVKTAANPTAPSFRVSVTNTGAASTVGQPGVPASAFAFDIYRVSVAVDGTGWDVGLQNALVAVGAGKSEGVSVFARRQSASAAPARVTITIVSESDATKRATTVTAVK